MKLSLLIAVSTFTVGALTTGQSRLKANPGLAEASGELGLSPETKQALCFGYRRAMSDWYWLSAIQYYGTPSNEDQKNRGLAPLLREATDLDPTFDYAYQFAGEALPYHDSQSGAWYNTEDTLQLLRRGMSAGTQRWQIPWLLGYNLYTYRGDYAAAGHAIEEAAQGKGAPPYLSSLAARLLAQGNDLETALSLTQAALAENKDEKARAELLERLKSLVLQQDLDLLNRAAAERRKLGVPSRLEDLVGYAGLEALPAEPFGGSFHLLSAGQVTSDDDDKLLHLHIHPGAPPVERYVD